MIDYDEIRDVHSKTVRIVTDAGIVPDNSSFLYKSNDTPVKKGTAYHIHYTTDFKEVYMTGAKHQPTSRIIRPLSNKGDYENYTNNRGKQYSLLKPRMIRGTPKTTDYVAGTFTRYFAKKLNDETEPVAEVNEKFNSPLYNTISVQWNIRGPLKKIYLQNSLIISGLQNNNPQVAKLLSNPLEYVRVPEITNDIDIKKRLGIADIPKDSEGNIVFTPEALTPPVKMGLNEGPGKFKMRGPKKGGGIGKFKINKGAFAKYGAGGGGSSGGGGGGGY